MSLCPFARFLFALNFSFVESALRVVRKYMYMLICLVRLPLFLYRLCVFIHVTVFL